MRTGLCSYILAVFLSVSYVGLSAVTAPAEAKQCRDAKGKFIKCPEPAKPAKCRDAKGRFIKCEPAGSKKTGK